LQLSLHADYACRVLIYLATRQERASIEDIATAFRISEHHLVKVVHRLGKLDVITTTRGRGGGLTLARAPAEINIGQVVRAMEQPNFNVAECFDGATNTCPIAGVCALQPWLAKAMEAFLRTLDGLSLADVAGKPKRIAAALGMGSMA
jgi:Rrf2 family nitric oxide-sensitive transcriptional repressor